MNAISYKHHHFPPAVIQQAVWLYYRVTLSLWDVEDLLAERGVEVSYETVRRWAPSSGQASQGVCDVFDPAHILRASSCPAVFLRPN